MVREATTAQRIIVVATKEELNLIDSKAPCIVTGIGALNILRALRHLETWTPILNIGYCGSGAFPVGTRVNINACDLWHPAIKYDEPHYFLDTELSDNAPSATCHTITDFGGDPSEEGCVFDMELAFILGMGFTNVRAVKVVSDNCDMDEYNKTIQANYELI